MNELTVLLAFALPAPEHARDLIKHLATPALSALLGYARKRALPPHPSYGRVLAHERYVTQVVFGCEKLPAAQLMQALGLAVPAEHCFMLNPVHIHIASDHLILTDQRQLQLSDEHAQALFAAAEPYFAEVGMQLHYGTAQHWFVTAPTLAELNCASIDAASGHNIEIWLPRQAQQIELQWRKLQNEIQMLWYNHPVNETRMDFGLPPVNALWLNGASASEIAAASATNGQTTTATRFAAKDLRRLPNDVFAPQSALAHLCQASAAATWSSNKLVYLDQLSAAALAGDWGDWLQHMQKLEESCFAPLFAQLKQGQLKKLTLVLSDSEQLLECTLTPSSFWWPWRKASLQALQTRATSHAENKSSR